MGSASRNSDKRLEDEWSSVALQTSCNLEPVFQFEMTTHSPIAMPHYVFQTPNLIRFNWTMDLEILLHQLGLILPCLLVLVLKPLKAPTLVCLAPL